MLARMSIDVAPFRILEGEPVRLEARPTRIEPLYDSKAHYRRRLAKRVRKISKLQRALYASKPSALLLIIQATDAAGKDGLIRHVMSGVNPQGCQVHNFEPPSAEELLHDFLWRTTVRLPERGLIGVFNRSYYEEVLVVRVHPDILPSEGVAEGRASAAPWTGRFRSILDHEAHLSRNGTKVVKVFLHLSKYEQRRRFLSRIDHPEKNWKLDAADMAERDRWDDYVRAYEACLSATSTGQAPWYAIPADDKKTARLIVAQLLLDSLRALGPTYPEVTDKQQRELATLRLELKAEP